MTDKHSILSTYFGYSTFRTGQEQIIDAVLQGRDALAIMPTGAGKSLCFQVPALLLSGITLVISPLISLMTDQVNALRQMDIHAAFLNSSLTVVQQRKVLDNAESGEYKIIYVAPERLLTPDFLAYSAATDIAFVCVDEAHCVSQWGQDFRPSYLHIHEFIATLPNRPIVGAFTATATARVREDITSLLDLQNPEIVATGFDRANLYFEVQSPKSKFAALERFLDSRKEKSGIVYCSTRKTVEDTCQKLNAAGYNATRYHAGLTDLERRTNQEDFQVDNAKIMVATNAFGMGIDKSNVAFVVHFNMPKNMESYYQEAGRAGRDGSSAECLLLYSGQDVITNQFFIDKSGENESMDAESLATFKKNERERLKQMTFYCNTQDCLRGFILKYFGDNASNHCGNCGSCLQNFDKKDITVDAQKILSCVKRMGEKYGVKLLVDTLRGLKNERINALGFDALPTYGIMKDISEKQLREMISFLLADGYLASTDDEYPIIHLTPTSKEILFCGKTLAMNLSCDVEPTSKMRREKSDTSANPRLFSKLQALRSQLAKAQSVPAYTIFPDATLHEICVRLPRDKRQMLEISGVGMVKFERYGDLFLDVVNESIDDGSADVIAFEHDVKEKRISPQKQALIDKGYTFAGGKWSEEEVSALRDEFASGLEIEKISQIHKRTYRAIEMRLEMLGLIEPRERAKDAD